MTGNSPATTFTKRRRVKVRKGHRWSLWQLHADVTLNLYAGLLITVDLGLGPWWCGIDIDVFYSASMEQRSWDRWQAETLAGEHKGVTVMVSGQ